MNSLVNNPKWAAAVMRALGIKGDLPQFVEGVFGLGFQAEDFSRFPYGFAKGDDFVAGSFTLAATPAQPSWLAVSWAPIAVNRQSCLHISKIIIQNNNAASQGYTFGLTDAALLPLVANCRYRDARRGNAATPSPWGIFGAGAAAPALHAGGSLSLLANESVQLEVDYLVRAVSDGRSGLVVVTGVNVALAVTFIGQELNLIPEELPAGL